MRKSRRDNISRKLTPSPLFWILLSSAVVRVLYYLSLFNTTAVDTASYINYHANILKGQTEGLRTPVYPYFIKLIKLFGERHLIDNVIIVQCVLSFLSIILFYKIAAVVFKNKWVIIAASIFYGIMLPVINFDKLALTESLSVSASMIILYLLMRYLQKPAVTKACLLTLFVFVTIMLRPSFIFLLPLVIAFWIFRLMIYRKDWKMCLSGFAAAGVVILLILGYSGLNKRNVNYNGISLVSNNNQIDVINKAGIYEYGNDPEITAAIKSNIQLIKANPGKVVYGINIMKRFAPDRVHQYIITSIKNKPGAYLHYIGAKLVDLQGDNIFVWYANRKPGLLTGIFNIIQHILFFPAFNLLYLFIVLDLIMIIIFSVKRKQFYWFKTILWLFIFGQVAVSILGGYSDYQRLILPAMPALVIALFYDIDRLARVINAHKTIGATA